MPTKTIILKHPCFFYVNRYGNYDFDFNNYLLVVIAYSTFYIKYLFHVVTKKKHYN